MRNEITAAVLFLAKLIEKNEKLNPKKIECFKIHLTELLTERFKNHWYLDKPFKGQGYRCIRLNGYSRRDEILVKAAHAAGIKYEDLSLPIELTLWIDPYEVCCRFGENNSSYCTLATFEKENTINFPQKDYSRNKNKSIVESLKNQKSSTMNIMDQKSKLKPLSSSNRNVQQQNTTINTASTTTTSIPAINNNRTDWRRNLNSPRAHVARNLSWYSQSFRTNYGPRNPINQPRYNIIPPHFLGQPPFMGQRANKWINPASFPT